MKDEDYSETEDHLKDEINCLQTMRTILHRQIRIIDALIAAFINHESVSDLREEDDIPMTDVVQAVVPILQAVGSSSNTLESLSASSGLHTRDCYGIARSIVEASINICYILSEGDQAAKRALRHARQKSFLDLKRVSTVGGSVIKLELERIPDTESIEGLAEDISEFTSKSGREKGWIDLSVNDRILAVKSALGERIASILHWARFAIYRHSSEILHGTLFGAMHFFGLSILEEKTSKSVEGFELSVAHQHIMILQTSLFSLFAIVDAFHKVYGFPWAVQQKQVLFDELKTIPLLNPSE